MLDTPTPPAKSTQRLQQLLPQLFDTQLQTGDRYLKVDLDAQNSALIALEDIRESMQTSIHSVTPIPNLPTCILGLMNARNQVLGLVDLALLMNRALPVARGQHYSVVVVRTPSTSPDSSYLGLAVQNIHGIIRLAADDVQSSVEDVADELAAFLRGQAEVDGQRLPILDVRAIANASALQGA